MFKQIPISVKLFILCLLINTIFVVAGFSMSNDESLSNKGERVFKANCAGCHLNGQNLIKADKPIIGSIKIKSKPAFKKFLEAPPPPMPKFENIISMDGQFNALYSYVITLMGK